MDIQTQSSCAYHLRRLCSCISFWMSFEWSCSADVSSKQINLLNFVVPLGHTRSSEYIKSVNLNVTNMDAVSLVVYCQNTPWHKSLLTLSVLINSCSDFIVHRESSASETRRIKEIWNTTLGYSSRHHTEHLKLLIITQRVTRAAAISTAVNQLTVRMQILEYEIHKA